MGNYEEWIKGILEQWGVIKSALPLFGGILVAVAIAIWVVIHFLYSVRLDSAESRIKNYESEVRLLEQKLKASTPRIESTTSIDQQYIVAAKLLRRAPMYSSNLFNSLYSKGTAVVYGDPREENPKPEGLDPHAMQTYEESLRIVAAQYLLKEGYIKSIEKLGDGKYSLIASEKVKAVKLADDELRKTGD